MPNLNSRIICTIVAGLASGSLLMAQQTFGSFKGRVTEKGSGAAKAGVAVTIENTATGYTRTGQTGSDGTFRFQVVPLGNYKIVFKSADSTASMIRTSQLGMETDASVAMAAAAGTTVTVVATADTVDTVNTTSAEVGVNVSSERLESLPVLTRNVVSAAVLAPGVQLIQGSNVDPTKKSSTYMSTGEGQGRGTNFNIDGGDNNSTDVGGYVSPIPMDAIGEFQVVTNQYKAEFGRSNAGFMNVASKAGSNTFSGIISAQYTNQSMRARSTDEGDKKDNNAKDLNVTVSGPILKDKLFFMVSVERKDEESAAATFSNQAVAVFPELGGIKTQLKETIAYMRFDWAASQAVNATFTYSYDKNETPNQVFPHTGAANYNVDPGMLGTGLNKTNRYGLKVTTNFTSNFIWESNLMSFDYTNGIKPHAGLGMDSGLQVRTRNSTSLHIDPLDLCRTGADPNAFQNTGIKRAQWRNDFTYVMGEHFFKAGLDIQKCTYADQTLFFPETGPYRMWIAGYPMGTEMWGSRITDPVADNLWANQHVIGFDLVAYGFQRGQDYKQYGFYAQDDWTVSPKLSVYFGVRADKDNIFDFFDQWKGLYQDIYEANPYLLHGAKPPENKTYISPRLQMVYKPKGDDSVTFKVGYGKFVANVIDNVTGFSRALYNNANGLNPGPFNNSAARAYAGASRPGASYNDVANFSQGASINAGAATVVLAAAMTPYNYINNVNGLRDQFRVGLNGALTPASFDTAGKNLMASDFEYPTTDTINLGATFKIGEHQTLDLQYIYSRTKNASTYWATDGSDIRAWSPTAKGLTYSPDPDNYYCDTRDQADNIFTSNQSARSHQLQVKYTYTSPKFTALFNLVAKDAKASYGGSAGSYDAHGAADFYGGGATYPYIQNPERRSAGTEALNGSFSFTYNFDFGTKMGVLGTWHSGKYYDVFAGFNGDTDPDGYALWMDTPTLAHPIQAIGTDQGDWNLDIGLRISQAFKVGKGMTIEPFIQISNILNNYDYGANYNQTMCSIGYDGNDMPYPYRNENFGKRGNGWQLNQPRTAAFGFRFTF